LAAGRCGHRLTSCARPPEPRERSSGAATRRLAGTESHQCTEAVDNPARRPPQAAHRQHGMTRVGQPRRRECQEREAAPRRGERGPPARTPRPPTAGGKAAVELTGALLRVGRARRSTMTRVGQSAGRYQFRNEASASASGDCIAGVIRRHDDLPGGPSGICVGARAERAVHRGATRGRRSSSEAGASSGMDQNVATGLLTAESTPQSVVREYVTVPG